MNKIFVGTTESGIGRPHDDLGLTICLALFPAAIAEYAPVLNEGPCF
jgi:hypothetical protein